MENADLLDVFLQLLERLVDCFYLYDVVVRYISILVMIMLLAMLGEAGPHLLKEGLQTASWPESGSSIPIADILHLVALTRLHWLLLHPAIACLLLLLLDRGHSSWSSRCLPIPGCSSTYTSRTWTVSAACHHHVSVYHTLLPSSLPATDP